MKVLLRPVAVRRLACFLTAVLLCTGCSDKSGTPTGEQASVSGTVTYDGAPITVDSSIVFSCLDPAVTASGQVDSLGSYALRPANKEVGIPAGRYRVMIRAPEPPMVTPTMGTPEYQQMMQSGGSTQPPKFDLPKDIPLKFTSFDTSGIVVELKPGANTLDFDLAKLGAK